MPKNIDLKVEIVQLDSIIPYINNAKLHPPEQVAQIAASITAFGFNDPIGVSGGTILTGHGRLMAARQLGMQTVPIIRLDHLSPVEQKAYCLAHNKIGANSGFGPELLKIEFEALNEIKWDLSLTGFDPIEIKESLNFVFNDPDKEGTDTAPGDTNLNEPAYTQLGDIYQLGMHKVMCGDSTDAGAVFLLLEKQKIDMVFTDPPYGINVVGGGKAVGSVGGGKIVKATKYHSILGDSDTKITQKFYSLCKENGLEKFIIFGGNYFTDFLPPSRCWLIWDKQNTGNFADVEIAWTSFDEGAKLYKFLWNGLCREGNRNDELRKRVHPTQKPVGLFVNIFKDFDFKTCFDGFLGSGSTLIAAENLGRICYGMELDPHYCDVIVKRFQKHTKSQDIKLIRGNETISFDMLKKTLDFEL